MAKQTFYEGQTATNPATGEKVMYRGGKWFPTGGAGTATPVAGGSPQDRDALQALRDTANKTLSTSEAANRFVELNEKSPTGGLVGRPIIPGTKILPGAPLWGDLGAAVTGDTNWSQMKSINSALAPAQREPGSGASSDLDVKMFRESLPNIDAPGPANRMNAERLQDKSDRASARSAFMDEWFARRGTLLGAEQQFATFWGKRKAGDPAANRWTPAQVQQEAARKRAQAAQQSGGSDYRIVGVED
ncbi:MAG: hypothetical protein V4820_11600 [Pseudomonadota bacterium]